MLIWQAACMWTVKSEDIVQFTSVDNKLTGGPWTNYIKGLLLHFEFTEEFIIIKVLTKITIKHCLLYTSPSPRD